MFTYFFGAGASAQSIPIANDLLKSLVGFERYLIDYSSHKNDDWRILINEDNLIDGKLWLNKLREKLNVLISGARYHQTIDTYAKMLFLTQQSQPLHDLKTVLSCYFLWAQYRVLPDNRYDHFIASIIENNISNNECVIPKNIRIISWNYDVQFEIALSKYLPSCKCTDILNRGDVSLQFESEFPFSSVSKLNGCCLIPNLKIGQKYHFDLPIYDENEYDVLSIEKTVASFYLVENNVCNSILSFAWENEHRFKSVITYDYSQVDHTIFKTKYLIIVGYSFPFFNRHIDRGILNKMVELEKVYIQGKPEHLAGLITKLKSFIDLEKAIEFIPINDTTQFFLPPEL